MATTETFVLVNTGLSEDDGTGDNLRNAFLKVNGNFSNIAATGFNAGNVNASGTVFAEAIVANLLTIDSTCILGANANVKINGGLPNQVLQTDGSGNLSWYTPAGVGTINGSFTGNLAYYQSNGDTLSGTGANLQWDTSTNNLLIRGEVASTLADATALAIALGG